MFSTALVILGATGCIVPALVGSGSFFGLFALNDWLTFPTNCLAVPPQLKGVSWRVVGAPLLVESLPATSLVTGDDEERIFLSFFPATETQRRFVFW